MGTSNTHEQRLADTFVELADTLVDDFDVVEFLHRLSVRCVELLGVRAAGLLLADPQGDLHTAAVSEEHPWLLDLLGLQQEDGPCHECYRTGTALPPRDLAELGARWPDFAESARSAGFASAYTVPLRLRQDVIGALHLLRSEPVSARDVRDARIAQALADAATIGILQQRTLRQRELLAGQLQSALNSRVVVEQAKGVLAERGGVTVDEGFTLLRRYARTHRMRLSEVARKVVEGGVGIPEVSPPVG